jgi:lysophospholipase L1-like esterase
MRFFACLVILLAFYSCKKTGSTAPAVIANSVTPAPAILVGDAVSYLALGDSYTYGLDVQQNQSYPYQLDSVLRQNGYKPAAPVVIARFGWTSGDLLAGMAAANITQHFDMVTLLIGVNDQNKGVNAETYRSNLDQLLTNAVLLAKGYGSRVFVISIPNWSVTPFAANMNKAQIAAAVQLFNTVNQAEAGKFKVNYIDITALSDLMAGDPTLVSSDGLHPSAKMYNLWVNQFYGKIVDSFKQ